MTTTFETQGTGDRAATLNTMATVQSATPTAATLAATVTPTATAPSAPVAPTASAQSATPAATVQSATVMPTAAPQAATVTAPPRYQSRPGRGVVVAPSLADLQGPTEGTVELPLWLFWSSPGHTFDLGDRDMRLWLYQTVLREASSLQDLTAYLDGDTLIALWPDLYLPKGVRQAWEDTHPFLRATVVATA
jgi:Tfp pilus assembly protein FimV